MPAWGNAGIAASPRSHSTVTPRLLLVRFASHACHRLSSSLCKRTELQVTARILSDESVANRYKLDDRFERKVICYELDPADEVQSEFRVLFDGKVKYIVVGPKTYELNTLRFDLLKNLPNLPLGDWSRAYVFRENGHLSFKLSYEPLDQVHSRWHPVSVEITSLPVIEKINPSVLLVGYGDAVVVAKFSTFEWTMPSFDRETEAYRQIEGKGIGPAFLAHVTENGRVTGFLLEKVEGGRAEVGDLDRCREVVLRLHALGVVHGDLNRHNFIVSPSEVTLIDFADSTIGGSTTAMEEELLQLPSLLEEDTGRGGTLLMVTEGTIG